MKKLRNVNALTQFGNNYIINEMAREAEKRGR